jgi:predicted ATPase
MERALSVARQQGALSWELRGAITLARLRSKQGRGHEGRGLVASVYARFTEGYGTPDIRCETAAGDIDLATQMAATQCPNRSGAQRAMLADNKVHAGSGALQP